jgi:hypothetical protein
MPALILAVLLQAASPAPAAGPSTSPPPMDMSWAIRQQIPIQAQGGWTVDTGQEPPMTWFDRREREAEADHVHLREAMKLEAWPDGDVVIRIVTWPSWSHAIKSTTAYHTAAGWRVEQVTGERGQSSGDVTAVAVTSARLSPPVAARLERLLATPALYAEPMQTDACHDGIDTFIDIWSHGRGLRAYQVCAPQGLTGQVIATLTR